MKMKKIQIFDTTLRDGEQASGFHMYPEEKLQVARGLAEMGVDIIEAGNPISSPGDYNAVRRICEEVEGTTIAGLARCVDVDIDAAGRAIEPAIERGKGRIHVYIATSDIHTEKKLRKSRDNVLDMVNKSVSKAKGFTDDVQFSPEDFTRSNKTESNRKYSIDVICEAIGSGATTINLADTVGHIVPYEVPELVRNTIKTVNKRTGNENVIYSFHGHDDLGLSTANSIGAILGGARQIEVAMNGIGERAGNTALEEVVANIKERSDFFEKFFGYPVYTTIDTRKIKHMSDMVASFTGNKPQRNKAIVGENAFSHEAGVHQDGMWKDSQTYESIKPEDYGSKSRITFGPRSGRKGLIQAYEKMRIVLGKEQLDKVAERFMDISDDEKEIDHYHLSKALTGKEMNPVYELVSAKTWAEDDGAQAKIILRVNGDECTYESIGNGMIDASVKAINRITNLPIDIIDYKSESATSGSEAMGREIILVKNNGLEVRGYGLDVDVVRGSIKAYVDASNKMNYVLETVEAHRI